MCTKAHESCTVVVSPSESLISSSESEYAEEPLKASLARSSSSPLVEQGVVAVEEPLLKASLAFESIPARKGGGYKHWYIFIRHMRDVCFSPPVCGVGGGT